MISVILISLGLFLLSAQFLKLQWKSRGFPPGPTPFPIVGSMWWVKFRTDHGSLRKMAKTYGNICTLWLGHRPVVVLYGFQAVKDGLTTNSEDVSGRLQTFVFNKLANGKGILVSNGLIWKQQRHFGIGALRKLGMGNKGMERGIQTEAHYLVEFFRDKDGKAVDPSFPIVHAVSNVICAVVFGHRFSLEDETFRQLIEAYNAIVAFGNSRIYFISEIFTWAAERLSGSLQKAVFSRDFVCSFVRQEIKSHREKGRIGEPEDFIDFYLDQIEKTKNIPNSTFDEDNMVQSVFDLFFGGTETTATTLRWALLYMLAYPDIQEKVQKELDAVLSPSHLICYEDRKKLPYTNAVVHEILRFSSIVLITIPRETVKDTTVLGYRLPKGTLIMANIDSTLFDPDYWETPHQFNPGHFLDKDGNFVTREAFLAFSAGHRACLGEVLAKMELFIIFCRLLQTFKFTTPEGVKEVNTDFVFGSTMKPHPYKLCAVPR
ncbi:PREDICTED: cytochrome P450 2J6-like isoform X3 [Lepidothrix coronata]|uniref:Cytochrome P450 2J6-like isoform X3 n=1 Tax=Lepidothrix coronata TaxID=321398 RepID=A0A6J0GW81_9PASS|nr:PREDICTED: cytochrome P450 2J6-like isoform X3 [Lepidothrix coronata]XP_017666258.1 PREDICTED: cytochrome P450 2J6-like isoform X3 [Lepidothrix coronata]XP_017666259.1 PREDICTED: cytochrome P450 2J6-like isoform X3 [Lepidothrix coronata]